MPRLIPDLAELPLAEIVELPLIKKHLGPLLERHRRSIDIMRERTDSPRRRDLFRRERPRSRGLQQIRAVLSVSGRALFGGRERFADARESFRGNEPVEGSSAGRQSRVAVRKVRRRRACARGGDFAWARAILVRARQVAKEIAATLAPLIAVWCASPLRWERYSSC